MIGYQRPTVIDVQELTLIVFFLQFYKSRRNWIKVSHKLEKKFVRLQCSESILRKVVENIPAPTPLKKCITVDVIKLSKNCVQFYYINCNAFFQVNS